MDKHVIVDKISTLSSSIYSRNFKQGAELVLLSERVYEAVEEDYIVNNTLLASYVVIQPNEWKSPPKAPCDIRLLYFGSNSDIIEEYTFE